MSPKKVFCCSINSAEFSRIIPTDLLGCICEIRFKAYHLSQLLFVFITGASLEPRWVLSDDLHTFTVKDVCKSCPGQPNGDLMVIQCIATNGQGYAASQGYLNVLGERTLLFCLVMLPAYLLRLCVCADSVFIGHQLASASNQ